MSIVRLHDFAAAWSVAGSATASTGLSGPHEDAPDAQRFGFPVPAAGDEVFVIPPAPVDLSFETELRFWIRVPRTSTAGFPVLFGYTDATDAPGTERLWRVPVARPGRWEQVRIGCMQENRAAVDRLFFRPLGSAPVTADLGELLAMRPEMTLDVETALSARIAANTALGDLAALPVTSPAAAGATQVQIADIPGLVAGSLVEIDDGGGSVQQATLDSVSAAGGTATLTLGGGAALAVPLAVGTASVTGLIRIDTDPYNSAAPQPAAVRLTLLDAREDRRRTHYVTLTDSFRQGPGGALTVSERPHPRGWLLDYQLTSEAPLRTQRLRLLDQLSQALNFDRPLRVGGVMNQLEMFLRPDLPRQRTALHPETLHLRISAEQEAGSRRHARVVDTIDTAVVPEGAPAEAVRIA
ncbi:hypothetical protein [Roseibium marinum]|uniref:Uncharacterized protein n=1 Tax=Roseibium marinum TaxID=281252 RepID=A0A2S3UN19_9HYPH|nr:hypothetical protein [Roseibium marinum]POF29095.1 hypothetical protein CLV41_11099 [Roseibium marinum]